MIAKLYPKRQPPNGPRCSFPYFPRQPGSVEHTPETCCPARPQHWRAWLQARHGARRVVSVPQKESRPALPYLERGGGRSPVIYVNRQPGPAPGCGALPAVLLPAPAAQRLVEG